MTKNVPGNFAGEGAGPIKQHQTMARGGSADGGNFGVQALASLSRGNGFSGAGNKLADSQRKAAPPVSVGRGRRSQAQPDHGPSY